MFEKLIQSRQNKMLQRIIDHPRQKKMASFDAIQQIGIIFNVGDEQQWNQLYAFVKEMEQQKKQVWMIGFQPDKQTIGYIFTHSRTIICHEKEDFNFWGQPKEGVIDGFVGRHYDLLINTIDDPTFFSIYTAAKTVADLRVCYHNTAPTEIVNPLEDLNIKVFDMIIKDDKKMHITSYLQQMVHYINMMKGTSTKS